MASEVEVSNLALSHIGDGATVTSIDPPEGSPQAEYCKQFLPIARDIVLSSHDWQFATRRFIPAKLTPENTQWLYAYAIPANVLTVRTVIHKDAPDDYAYKVKDEIGIFTQQEYTRETLADGTQVILTNQDEAAIKCVVRVTDLGVYPPLVVQALSYRLASFLAGPVIKGEVGMKTSQQMLQMYGLFIRQAAEHDARQKKINVKQQVDWLVNR